MPPRKKWFGPLRRFRHRLTKKLLGRPNTFTNYLKTSLGLQQKKGIWSQIGVQNLLSKDRSTQREHFGPKGRIPQLFQRRDQVYLALEAQRLQWHMPPPVIYHDLLDATARVGRIEERMGYTFKDKMLCIEALKVTSSVIPLYFKGVVHQVGRNNRMALLGDRVLSLALCEIWFQTGNTTDDYSKMSFGSESRAVLSARGHALGIHKNLLLHQWPYTLPSDNNVAETFEAILGAVYLDSGNSIEAVKKVITQAELDKHKLLKANAESQDVQERRELTALRNAEQAERERVVAVEARRQARAAALVRKQAAEQAKRQVQEGDTTTEGQIQNESSETAQTQTRSEGNTALTHAEASENLADFLIRYKTRMKEKERLKTDKQRSQVLNEEAPSQNRDQALDSRTRRRAVAAASKLSKEGNLLGDVSEHDGTTADSGRQRSPVSRVEDQDKVDTSLTPHSQDPQTSPPAEVTTSKAEDQPQQNSAVSTATTENIPLSNLYRIPVEEFAGLGRVEARRRRRAWWNAVGLSTRLKKKGIDQDVQELYEQSMRKWLPKKQADGLNAPNKTLGEHPSTEEADGLSAPKKEVGEYLSTKEANELRNAERVAKKAERRAQRKIEKIGQMRARSAAFRERKGYEEGPTEIQPQKDPVAPLKPSEETTQAPASLLPEPPTTTVTKADSILENMGPASITAQQERSPAIGSDEADTATSTVPAPTQELSSSLKKTGPPALNASQQGTSPALWSGETETVTSPAPAPVQKLSSSLGEPGPAKSARAASKNRNKPTRELSSYLEETGFASASATDMDDDKEIQVRTKDVGQLERDILNSHKDIWQAAGTADSLRKRNKRVASARRSLRNSLILAEQLAGRTPARGTATREEDAEPKNWMQKEPKQAGTNARPFVRFDFYESDTERFMANITQDDPEALDTPRLESGKKPNLHTPSFRTTPGSLRFRAKPGELSLSESKR